MRDNFLLENWMTVQGMTGMRAKTVMVSVCLWWCFCRPKTL